MKAICVVLGWWYTLRAGGYGDGFRVSGHQYGEPVYDIVERKGWALVPTEEYVGPAEQETLTCGRCGEQSVGWRPMP